MLPVCKITHIVCCLTHVLGNITQLSRGFKTFLCSRKRTFPTNHQHISMKPKEIKDCEIDTLKEVKGQERQNVCLVCG